MARSLTSPTSTEAAKATGAFPRWILEVQFPSPTGTKYFAAEALTSPVTAQGRIRRIGPISIAGEPGKAGGVNSVEIELADEDQFFKGENETKPGIQAIDSFLWLWFEGTTWPDDRVLEVGGILTAPMRWDEQTATFRTTLKGFEHKYDIEIGELATTTIFPEMDCADCENNLIPIVYGAPCYRVPACVIDRPGAALLNSALSVTDSTLTINSTASEAGFTVGSSIDLAVGYGRRWERITGSFANGSTSTFDITDRGSIEGSGTGETGTTAGTFGSGGFTYLTLPEADFSSPTTSRAGHSIWVNGDLDGTGVKWHQFVITHWSDQGVDRAVLIQPQGMTFSSSGGHSYKVAVLAGHIPYHNPGAPVREIGTWKYAVNFLPSQSVVRVEAPTQIDEGGGSKQTAWLEINSAHYTVDHDDRAFNTALGRAGTDPGLTTVTLSFTPVQLGLDEETIYVTLNGTIDVGAGTSPAGTFGDTAVDNPADVIEHLLTNGFLGNVPTARVNSSSFTTAATLISTKCSFALLDDKKSLHDLSSDIAYQAHSLYFWDEGQAQMKVLERPLVAGDSQLTITRDDYSNNARLQIEEVDVKNYVTELQGRFRPAVPAGELVLVRDSSGAKDDFGVHREQIDFWAYQFPTSVALAVEFWLEYLLETNRRVIFTTWMNALALQPGDTITLNINDGAGTAIFSSVLAQVTNIRRQVGNLRDNQIPRTEITCVTKLYDYTITTATPSDTTCIGSPTQREFERSGKLYLASTGTGRSLYVKLPANFRRDAGSGIQKPIVADSDPNANHELTTNLLIEGIATPPCP